MSTDYIDRDVRLKVTGKHSLCTTADIRRILSLSSSEIANDKIEYFIRKASEEVIESLVVRVFYEELETGDTDQEYFTEHVPLADTDGDGDIDGADVQLYETTDDEDTMVELRIDKVYSKTGQILLSDSPSTGSKVYGSYAYYLNAIEQNLVKDAVTYLAAYKLVASEFYLIPERLTMSTLRTEHRNPAKKLLDEYYRIMNVIRSRMFIMGEVDETVMRKRRRKTIEASEYSSLG